jgi:hypothetical protein
VILKQKAVSLGKPLHKVETMHQTNKNNFRRSTELHQNFNEPGLVDHLVGYREIRVPDGNRGLPDCVEMRRHVRRLARHKVTGELEAGVLPRDRELIALGGCRN